MDGTRCWTRLMSVQLVTVMAEEMNRRRPSCVHIPATATAYARSQQENGEGEGGSCGGHVVAV